MKSLEFSRLFFNCTKGVRPALQSSIAFMADSAYMANLRGLSEFRTRGSGNRAIPKVCHFRDFIRVLHFFPKLSAKKNNKGVMYWLEMRSRHITSVCIPNRLVA